jgi:hypothetical protein
MLRHWLSPVTILLLESRPADPDHMSRRKKGRTAYPVSAFLFVIEKEGFYEKPNPDISS